VPKKKKFKKSGVAPLVEPDKNELGDKRLDPTENNAKLREELLATDAKKKYWHQEELEDPDRTSGARIEPGAFLARISKLSPQLKIRDGVKGENGTPDSVALYFPRDQVELDEALRGGYCGDDEFFIFHKYVGGFPMRPLQEYAGVVLDSSQVAVREYRGWRTVLIQLIKAKVITYAQAIKEFGDPSGDQRARFWFDQLPAEKYRR
jgi:hypothetical protein